MTWVRIDDSAAHHHKLLDAGPDGVALWLAGLCYANRHTTDGRIPAAAIGALYPAPGFTLSRARRTANRLTDVSLWRAVENGWEIVNYERYQREATSAIRDSRREADRLGKRERRKPVSKEDPKPVQAMSDSDTPPTSVGSDSDPSRVRRMSEHPVPSRPVPSQVERPPQTWTRTGEAFRKLLGGSFEKRKLPAPKELIRLTDPMWGDLGRVVEEVARLRGWPHDEAMYRLADGWVNDPKVQSKGYPLSFLAANPNEYLPKGAT